MTIGEPNNEWQFSRCSGASVIKDWQFSITSDLRGDLVESVFHNIIKSILPASSGGSSTLMTSAVLSERRRVSLLQFAHKVEAEMYHRSESKQEYMSLISRKIASIRREFEERRLLRKIDNLANNAHKQPTGSHQSSTGSSAGTAPPHAASHHSSAWMQALSVEYRLQIVKRILQVICPLEPRAVYDLRFLHLIKYVQKIEKDIYKVAKSKEEYYQLLADKVHKILVELNHKRARRQERLQKDQLSTAGAEGARQTRSTSSQSSALISESLASASIKSHMSSIRRAFERPVEINQ